MQMLLEPIVILGVLLLGLGALFVGHTRERPAERPKESE